ncbi:MAG TPA: hypothetical protein VFQ07_09220 [Candidatus Polarisedimenticolia bacterium]|nr:hypothetical protein [Candidatus Polarisedimenticolia bacterium]
MNWFDRFLLGYIGIVAAVLLAPAYLVLFLTLGRRLRTLLRVPLAPSLRTPGDLLTGAWLWSLGLLALGLAGLFRNSVLLALLLVTVMACFLPWKRDKRSSLPPVKDLLAVGLPAAVLLPIALGPPFFYDALVYHLGLPWQALKDGAIAGHPEDLFSTFPPLAQLIYAQPVSIGSDQVPALLHFGSFLAAGLAVTALARRLAPRGAAAGSTDWRARLAGATVPLLPAVVLVPALPAAEGWLLAAVVTALAVAVGPEARHRRPARLATPFFGMLLAGIAVSARLQGLAWSAIVAVVLLPRVLRAGRRRGWGLVWQLGIGLLGWGSGNALWRLKNLLLLDDPMAPLMWHREGIETLFRDSGAQMLTAAAGLGDILAALGSALRPHLGYLLPLALASLLAVLAGGGDDHAARTRCRLILLAALLGLAAWAATGTLPRFLAPTLALLLALTAAAAGNAFRTSAAIASGCIVFLLGFAFTVRDPVLRQASHLLFEPDALTLEGSPFIINNPFGAFGAGEMLPASSRTLFVAEARAYRFPRRVVIPSQHDPSPLRGIIESTSDAQAIADRLRADGITHLLINRAEMRRLAAGYPVLPWKTPEGQARFQALLEACGPPIGRSGETALFALPPPRTEAATAAR